MYIYVYTYIQTLPAFNGSQEAGAWETYYRGKRDLLYGQKRSTTEAKET
jgi:hypothetical protein